MKSLIVSVALIALSTAVGVLAQETPTSSAKVRAVNVYGAVEKPGRIALPQDRSLTVAEVISIAGGPAQRAEMKRVKVTRKNARGEVITTQINVSAVANTRNRAATHVVESGDTVFVPERQG